MAERGGRFAAQSGQASIELVAGLPALLLAGFVALQLLATGYSVTLADGAAEAGALALASRKPVAGAARAALPGWARDRVRIEARGGQVTVRLLPPSPLHSVAKGLEVSSTAWVREPAGG
jgi:hypothetical protein